MLVLNMATKKKLRYIPKGTSIFMIRDFVIHSTNLTHQKVKY